MFIQESRSTFSATEKDEEETKEEDDCSQRTTDNRSRPSSVVLAIGIDTVPAIIGATTTIGSSSNAARVALLAEWVSRIEGMCDLAGTGRNDPITSGPKRIRETI